MLRWNCACSMWLLSLAARLAYATLSNRTIDDYYGDSVTGVPPFYSGNWSYGPNGCGNCEFKPNVSQCYNETWHEVIVDSPSSLPYFNLAFTGTAIYVFAIMPASTQDDPAPFANLTFTLNNNLVSIYVQDFANMDSHYNVPIYVNESMPNAQYILQVEPQYGVTGSYFSFDYAVYTFDGTSTTASGPASTQSSAASSTATSAPERPSHTGAIVGGAIGGVAAIIILALVVFFLRRRNHGEIDFIRQVRRGQDSTSAQDAVIEPFDTQISQHPFAAGPSLASPLRPPSPVGSVARYSIAENEPRRQQLVHQVREMERSVTTLKTRRGEEVSPPLRSGTTLPGDGANTVDALRAQLETLQLDMERLKAVQEETMAPPPAY